MTEPLSVTEALVLSGKTLRLVPRGRSMLPLLDGESDSVVVVPLRSLPKRFSLALYRDAEDALVVHRVVAVHGETGTCDLLGDGNLRIERDVPLSSLCGVVERIRRRGHEFSVNHPVYKLYTYLWYILLLCRKRLLGRMYR